MKEEKIWGTADHIFASPHCAVSILETKAGGYCSRHYHEGRINRFVVLSGVIDVVEYDADQKEKSRRRLFSSFTHDVPVNVLHRFEVVEPGFVVEVYFAPNPVRHDDIVRLDTGGIRELDSAA